MSVRRKPPTRKPTQKKPQRPQLPPPPPPPLSAAQLAKELLPVLKTFCERKINNELTSLAEEIAESQSENNKQLCTSLAIVLRNALNDLRKARVMVGDAKSIEILPV